MLFLSASLVISLEAHVFTADRQALIASASDSPRPLACRAAAGRGTLWQRARAEGIERYCELLGRGYARLGDSPAEALQAAERADAIAGASPEAWVLEGRADLRLGRAAAAFEQFRRAEAANPQAIRDPRALHDYARAASMVGKAADTVRLYRVLISRQSLVDVREREVLTIEAAAHVLAYVPGGSEEALGYLARARRSALGFRPLIVGLSLLVATRNGTSLAQGLSDVPSLTTLQSLVTPAAGAALVLPMGEFDALRAAVLEQTDRAASRAFWQAFLAHANSANVWLAQARRAIAR